MSAMSTAGRVGLLGVSLAVLLGCAPAPVEPPRRLGCAPPAVQDEDAIRETVLRDLIDATLGAGPRNDPDGAVRVVFLGIDDGTGSTSDSFVWDPPASFIARFDDLPIPARAASAARLGTEARDRVTGDPGAVFSTGWICWVGPQEVEVQASRWAGMTSGAWYTVHVARRDGRWVVTSRDINTVS
jgi:hypothetical protein